MQHDEFIGQVQHRARLASRGAAEVAVRAVLETLAERITTDEANNAAAQLPKGIGDHLRSNIVASGLRFGLDEFYQLVADRADLDIQDAVFQSRVVIEVLGEALSVGEMDDILAQLPAEYAPLFVGSQGNIAASS